MSIAPLQSSPSPAVVGRLDCTLPADERCRLRCMRCSGSAVINYLLFLLVLIADCWLLGTRCLLNTSYSGLLVRGPSLFLLFLFHFLFPLFHLVSPLTTSPLSSILFLFTSQASFGFQLPVSSFYRNVRSLETEHLQITLFLFTNP